jgi:ferrous iron transport protein B
LHHALEKLVEKIEKRFPGLDNPRWVALRLLEGDQSIIQALRSGDLHGLVQAPPTMSRELQAVAA